MKQETFESMVLTIKEQSELMVDLSYSSLLYDNTTLAKEVYELEEHIDHLFERLHHDLFQEVKEGNLTVKTEAVGTTAERVTTYAYDESGRLLTATVEADADTEAATTTFTYDENDNVD